MKPDPKRSCPPPLPRGVRCRHVLLALVGALHFFAMPCAMALATVDTCEHCAHDGDPLACATVPGTQAGDNSAPGTGTPRGPVRVDSLVALLPVPAVNHPGLCPASVPRGAGLATGRHTGDPPLNIRHGNFRL